MRAIPHQNPRLVSTPKNRKNQKELKTLPQLQIAIDISS